MIKYLQTLQLSYCKQYKILKDNDMQINMPKFVTFIHIN